MTYALIEAAQHATRFHLGNFARANQITADAIAMAQRAAFPAGVIPAQFAQFFRANAALASELSKPETIPEFGIKTAKFKDREYTVREEIVVDLPHAQLKRFVKDGLSDKRRQPTMLLIAPLSGHHATLLRPTVEEFAGDHDVYITEWKDPRHIPLSQGSFNLDEYQANLIEFMHYLGERTHVVAVCQPGVPLTGALSYMEAHRDPCLPLSATMMGSPIDTSRNPTKVNEYASNIKKQFGARAIPDYFERAAIHQVSWLHPGAGQRVYPGQLQLASFYGLAPTDHMNARLTHYWNVLQNKNPEAVAKHETFYKEYDAVMDMPGDYYLQTLDAAFLNQRIADGTMIFKHPKTGEEHLVDPRNIRNVKLLAVEGQTDTITGLGQTYALLDLASYLEPGKKSYLQVPGGHYSLFGGSGFREKIAPAIREHIKIAEKSPHVRRWETDFVPIGTPRNDMEYGIAS